MKNVPATEQVFAPILTTLHHEAVQLGVLPVVVCADGDTGGVIFKYREFILQVPVKFTDIVALRFIMRTIVYLCREAYQSGRRDVQLNATYRDGFSPAGRRFLKNTSLDGRLEQYLLDGGKKPCESLIWP